jgi:CheY-like chemotaxis protein
LGHSVTLACSGIEAIKHCQKHSYDLIILDNIMPGMTGLEVVQYLKEGTQFVLHTSDYSNRRIRLQAMRLGAMGVIAKISGISAFQSSISPFLNQAESRGCVVC